MTAGMERLWGYDKATILVFFASAIIALASLILIAFEQHKEGLPMFTIGIAGLVFSSLKIYESGNAELFMRTHPAKPIDN